MHKSLYAIATSTLVISSLSSASFAGDLSFTPRIGVGYGNYALTPKSFRYDEYFRSVNVHLASGETVRLIPVVPGETRSDVVIIDETNAVQASLFTIKVGGRDVRARQSRFSAVAAG